MSSSTMSAAELEQRRQEELERQRQERLRQIREATEQYNRTISQYTAFGESVSFAMTEDIKRFESINVMKVACTAFSDVKTHVKQGIAKALSIPLPTEPDEIKSLTNALNDQFFKIKAAYDEGVKSFSKYISGYLAGQAELRRDNAFTEAFSRLSKIEQIEYEHFNFDALARLESRADETTLLDLDDAIAECSALVNYSGIDKEHQIGIIALLNKLRALASADSKAEINNAIRQYQELKPFVFAQINAFGIAYDEYLPLHLEAVELCRDMSLPAPKPIPKSGFASISALKSEISRLKKDNKKENERRFIRQMILKKLAKYGFSLSTVLSFREAKGLFSDLLNSNDLLPLRVCVTDNGVIIEPVLVSALNEKAVGYNATFDKAGITTEEKNIAIEKQISFCEMYPKIVAELEAEGIRFTNTRIRKAGETFAKICVAGATSTVEDERDKLSAASSAVTETAREMALE